MDIRTLNQDSLDDLVALYQQLNPEDVPVDIGKRSIIWAQTTASDQIKYIGVFQGECLVSVCQMVVVPNLTRGGLPYCLIENVVTDQAHRNKGYGKLLLDRVIQMAWEQRCYKVMLMSGRKSETVLNFYKGAGFSADEKTAFIVRADPAQEW